jgi:hypothetical protein
MTVHSSRTPEQERDFLIYYSRVLMREAAARRARDPRFARTLLEWAARARRNAQAIDLRPAQGSFAL